jgi:hypothetical protein
LCDIGGSTLLFTQYNGSPSALLSKVYPDYNWLPWKFAKSPNEFLSQNQRKFMDWAANKLNIKDMTDWYKVTVKVTSTAETVANFQELVDIGGLSPSQLRKKYSGLDQLLSEAYPEYDWLPWKFSACPPKYWDDLKNQRKFMDWASKQLNITDMSDWYKVTDKVTFIIAFQVEISQGVDCYRWL